MSNHTGISDIPILGSDNDLNFVGKKFGGFAAVFVNALAKTGDHIFFDRTESKDREYVKTVLRNHAANTEVYPTLVFPEGTCTSPSHIMMFKKGVFELDAVIYPIAIKVI